MDDRIARLIEERSQIKARDAWGYKKTFDYSLKILRQGYGLELSLIEKVILKHILEDCFNQLDQMSYSCRSGHGGFNPVAETVTQFLVEQYGIPHEYSTIHLQGSDKSDLAIKNHDEFKEYLRREQERMLLP